MRAPTISDAALGCGNVSSGAIGAPVSEEIEGRFGRQDPFGIAILDRAGAKPKRRTST
jgi:hypothetical protein